jgi:hypothetical protein
MIGFPIMKDTEQFNIRLPKILLYDIEFISQHMNVNRNDWLRAKIAELASLEKERIIETFEQKFISGMLSDKEFKEATGIHATEGMKELQEKLFNERKAFSIDPSAYLKAMAEQMKDKSKDIYLDKHMRNVINKIDKKKP